MRFDAKNKALKIFGLCVVVIGLASFSIGCEGKLFPEDEQRNVFHRYDGLRGNDEPQLFVDPQGREEVNLRGRLEPKDW